MNKKLVYEEYSYDREYKFEVYEKNEQLYDIWMKEKIIDEYMGENWFEYCDVSDGRHFTDTLEKAIEIGREYLKTR